MRLGEAVTIQQGDERIEGILDGWERADDGVTYFVHVPETKKVNQHGR